MTDEILDSLETLERKFLYIQSIIKLSKSTLKTFDEQDERTAFLMEGLSAIQMFLPYEELGELYDELRELYVELTLQDNPKEDEAEKTASGSSLGLGKEIVLSDEDLPF